MEGGNGGDGDATDLDRLTNRDLLRRGADPRGGSPESARDEQPRRGPELPERSRVEVVGMGVRDEDGIEVADQRRIRRRPVASERAEPIAEEGIGQETDAVELDQERRVAEVDDPDSAVGRLRSVAVSPGAPVRRCASSGVGST